MPTIFFHGPELDVEMKKHIIRAVHDQDLENRFEGDDAN